MLGPRCVDAACARALELEVVNVGKIGRMLEAGTERIEIQPALPGTVITGRFARDPDHFAVRAARTVEAAFAAALDEDAQ